MTTSDDGSIWDDLDLVLPEVTLDDLGPEVRDVVEAWFASADREFALRRDGMTVH